MEQIIYKKCSYLLTSSDGRKKLIYEFYKCTKDSNGNEQQENLNVLETNLIVKELVNCYKYEIILRNEDIFRIVYIIYSDNNGNMITFKKERKEKIQDFKNLKKQSNISNFLTHEQDQDFRLTDITYNISGISINIPARVLCPRDTLFFDYNTALELISKAKQNIKDKNKRNIEKYIPELTNNIVSKIILGNDYSMEATFVYTMIFSGISESINKNKIINSNLQLLNKAA